MNKLICVALVAFYIGSFVEKIGRIPEPITEPIQWWAVLMVSIAFVVPVAFAYLAGCDEADRGAK